MYYLVRKYSPFWIWYLSYVHPLNPDPREKPIHSFLSFLGLILPITDQKFTSYATLGQKMTIFEAFGILWVEDGVKRAFQVGLRQNKAPRNQENTSIYVQ